MSRSPAMLALYRQRKASRQCVQCGAGLQERDWLFCVECAESRIKARHAYRVSEKGREKDRKWQYSKYHEHRSRGLCVDCKEPAAPQRARCPRHLVLQSARQQESLVRKEGRS